MSPRRTADTPDLDALLRAESRLSADIAALLARTHPSAEDLAALRAFEADRRALVDDQIAPRVRAALRVRAAIEQLGRLGPLSEILAQAPARVAEALALARVLVARIDGDELVLEAVYAREDATALERHRGARVRLDYPLLEAELLRRRQGRLVGAIDGDQAQRHAFAALVGWTAYVTAPILVEGRVVGFVAGDRAPGQPPLSDVDLQALVELADGLAQVVERAVLSRRLREQRREVQRIATWADVRTGELSNGAISLSIDDAEGAAEASRTPDGLDEDGVIKLLTARELDVLALMADGKTNPEIAATLFVSAGTIKFHVKNILRKLQAANRADATSRYLKLTLTRGDGRNPTHR